MLWILFPDIYCDNQSQNISFNFNFQGAIFPALQICIEYIVIILWVVYDRSLLSSFSM